MNHSCLYFLLPSLFDLFDHSDISIMKYSWEECLEILKESNQLPKEIKKISETLPRIIQIKENDGAKYAYGILDGYVWKFEFEKISFVKFNDEEDEEDDKISINNSLI